MNCTEDYRENDHNTPEALCRYLRKLASLNKRLAHTDQESHYFRGELEEFYTGFRDRVNFPALIQEGSEIRFSSDNADNAFKERETSFIIVQNYGQDDHYDEIYAAFDLCEKIGDEIIRKMNSDKYRPECMVIKDFNLDYTSGIFIQNIRERYVGVRYSFTLKTLFWNEIDVNQWSNE